jgi:hypothetical protein
MCLSVQDKETLISLALNMSGDHRPEQKAGMYSSESTEEKTGDVCVCVCVCVVVVVVVGVTSHAW